MNQYDYLNYDYNNFEEKIFINNDKEITEDINQSESNDISQLEKDICILINYLRTNPIDYCNNIIKKKRYNNQEEMKLVYLLEDIHNKNEVLQPYIRSPEISSAARYLLDNIVIYYRKYHNLNLKNLDQNCLNLRTRLSNYGQRTGRIFETVLFKMDNPDDIVNHILMEEKGRNMLLSYKMKYIGVACNYVTPNLICSVIDIVQEFIPYKDLNNQIDLNNNNNEAQNIIGNNDDNHSYNYNKKNYGNMKKKYLYNQNNNESISLLNNLKEEKNQNYSYKRKGKSLKIIKVANNKEINKKINNNENKSNNKNEQDNNNEQEDIYNTPDRILEVKKNNDMCYTPDINNQNQNESKRSKLNNIKILNQKSENNNNNEKNENLDNNRFTMAGRTFKQQQEIIENSKRNLTKSKSVCSYDLKTINSRTHNSKNKFPRLKHEEKMEILHKINHRDSKTRNSQSPSEENIKGLTQQISNFSKNNNYEYNFDNKSGKSPGRSICNQDNYDLCSENEKINIFNNMNKGADGANQTFTDIKSNPGMEMNEEYSRNKINEIKNDLKNQIKKELRDEVREEIRNQFNKKLYKNQQREPIIIDIENYDNRSLKSNNIYYNNNDDKRNTYDGAELNERIYYNNNNATNYYDKKRGKTRWSSIQKYYYIKNNNNINNINNTNIYVPDNISQYSKNTYNNYRGRKSFDWKDFRNNNDYNNNNDNGMELKEQYKQKYEQFNYMPNNNINVMNNNDYINNQDAMRPDSYKNKKDMNNSFFNQGFKQRNRQEIKKLIKLYNLAKDDQRNKSINYTNNNNAYNIINNNKSISNTFFPQNNNNNNNSINDNTQNNINININNEINNNKGNDYNISYEDNNNNNFLNNRNNVRKYSNNNVNYNININEEENSIENDFVKGHRFQIKYQKVKPKGQIYSKAGIPRNISVKNINNMNINNRKNIKEIPISINSNKSEDMVNLNNNSNNYDNKNSNFEKEDKEDINSKDNSSNKGKDYIIEKKIYKRNYNEIKTYDAESNKNNIEDINSDINSIINEKLSLTGRFIDDNNNLNSQNNNINDHNTIDIKNYMDKNIIYKESRDKPIISKSEKMEDNNVVTTITTKTREIFTPDRKKNANDEYVVKRKAYKKQSDLIKEYKKYEKINNENDYNNNYDINEAKSSDGSKRDTLYNNKIRTKMLSFGERKTYDRNLYNNNNIYADLDDNNMEIDNNFKTGFQYKQKNFDNYSNMSPRFNYENNLTSKTTSYYKTKKYIPYPYYPYEYNNNYNEFINQPRNFQNKNESLEKKYIKDPEGNLIETYVKKTKYNDGSVLLEYV